MNFYIETGRANHYEITENVSFVMSLAELSAAK